VVYVPNGAERPKNIERYIQEAKKVDADTLRNYIRESFHKHDSGKYELLHSTPILATGIYNARHIICESYKFNWTLLHLEEELDKLVKEWDPRKHCILSGSLRACPFAAALAFMKTSPISLEIMDHFGPHSAFLEEHDLASSSRPKGLEYVYVSDFMIGGTELKIARAWASQKGNSLSKALFLGTLWDPKAHSFTKVDVARLVSLKGLHPQAKHSLLK
jgi:hypothetical protein